jgi:hypothetical protein
MLLWIYEDPNSYLLIIQCHINKIEMVQRRAARFVTSNYSREPGTVTSILQNLGWPTLETHRQGAWLILLYKIIHGEAAVDSSWFPTIVWCHKTGGSSLYHFDLVDVALSVWVPYHRSVLKVWSYEWLACTFLNILRVIQDNTWRSSSKHPGLHHETFSTN